MSDPRQVTPEEVDRHHTALGHSVELINALIDGTDSRGMSEEEKRDAVDRNVRHLEIMLAKDFWADRDLEPSRLAVARGRAWLE
jgi:hypothetical protein